MDRHGDIERGAFVGIMLGTGLLAVLWAIDWRIAVAVLVAALVIVALALCASAGAWDAGRAEALDAAQQSHDERG